MFKLLLGVVVTTGLRPPLSPGRRGRSLRSERSRRGRSRRWKCSPSPSRGTLGYEPGPRACPDDRAEILPRSSTSMTTTLTSSPTLRTSSTFSRGPGDAGDVQQAVLTGQQVDEGAEGLDGDHATGVLLARLGNLDDELDTLDGLVDGLAGAADKDGTILRMSTEAPVSSWMPRITLPPEPMTSRILSVGTRMETIRGAVLRVVWRGSGITSSIFCRMKARPSLACCRARAGCRR